MELSLLDHTGTEIVFAGYERQRLRCDDWEETERTPDAMLGTGYTHYANRHRVLFPQLTTTEVVSVHAARLVVPGVHELIFALATPIHLTGPCAQFCFPRGNIGVTFWHDRLTPEMKSLLAWFADAPHKECRTCLGEWSLLRDPCPGCGALARPRHSAYR